MNSDIRLSIGWNKNPKIVKLERKLGPSGVLSLLKLWTFTAQHRPDGILSGMDNDDVAIAADFPGETGSFIAVLEGLRLLDRAGNDWVIHDWKDNNPWASGFKARSEKAKKAIQARWDRRNKPNPDPDGGEKNTTSAEKEYSENRETYPELYPSPSPSPSPKEGKEGRRVAAPPPPPSNVHVLKGKSICPVDDIIAAWHEINPDLSPVKLASSVTPLISARWRDKPGPDIENWRKLFRYVRTCPFLMGKTSKQDRRPFRLTLRWLLIPENMDKILIGFYEDDEVSHG